MQAGGHRFDPGHVHQHLPAFQALTNWAVGRPRQIWEQLGTIRIPTDPRPVSERFRLHECKSGAWSSYANGRVVLAPLAKEFLARAATFHVCVAENANRAIRAPLAERLDGVGVFADSWRQVAYLAALKKSMHRLRYLWSSRGVPVMTEQPPVTAELPCGWREFSEYRKFLCNRSPQHAMFQPQG